MRRILGPLTAGLLGLAVSGCGVRIQRETPLAIDAAVALLGTAELDAASYADGAALDAAVGAATERVQASLDVFDPADEARIRAMAIGAVLEGDTSLAATLLAAFPSIDSDRKLAYSRVRHALDTGAIASAREQAWHYAHAIKPMRAAFLTLWYESFYRDAQYYAADVTTIEPGVQLTRLERLGGGSTITLKFKLEEETVGAFKPYQTRYQSNYRAEIAAYRLCVLMDCGFQVPHNAEVRVERRDFLDLYGLRNLESSGGYSANFSDLIWFTDAEGREWLHGTLKEWVPGFGQFPIEFTDYWSGLVARGVSRERLEAMTFDDAIAGFRGENGNYSAIRTRAGEATAIDLARQLSNLHLFDYLINNWDRYSGEFWGVNCQWKDGHFVSIDNGASFQASSTGAHASGTTWGRFGRVHIFSQSTFDRLRAIEPQHVQALFFPPRLEHNEDDNRFKLFLIRRQRALDRIIGQIESRGFDEAIPLD